jgi:hypothetical protein
MSYTGSKGGGGFTGISPGNNPGYNPQYSHGYQSGGKNQPSYNPQEPAPTPNYGYRNRFQNQQLPMGPAQIPQVNIGQQGPQGNVPYGQEQFDGGQSSGKSALPGLGRNPLQGVPLNAQPQDDQMFASSSGKSMVSPYAQPLANQAPFNPGSNSINQ